MTQANTLPVIKNVCQLDDNNIFIGETTADLDVYANDGSYLLPAGCVDTTPPETRPNHAAQWDFENQTWQHIPDHRGQSYYDTATGASVIVECLGELPDNITTAVRPSPYHTWDGTTWILSTEAEMQQLNDAKTNKIKQLNQQAQTFVDALSDTDTTPSFEKNTWQEQGREAIAWHDNPKIPTPMLNVIAQARGIPIDILRKKAYEKAIAYQNLGAFVAGSRQRLEDQIHKAQNLTDLNAIEIVFSLPTVEPTNIIQETPSQEEIQETEPIKDNDQHFNIDTDNANTEIPTPRGGKTQNQKKGDNKS